MRVWQPGGHLMRERGAKIEDWSWHSTRRRIGTLARFAARYKLRTALSIVSLLAATVTALAPPFLADDTGGFLQHSGQGKVLVHGIQQSCEVFVSRRAGRPAADSAPDDRPEPGDT